MLDTCANFNFITQKILDLMQDGHVGWAMMGIS